MSDQSGGGGEKTFDPTPQRLAEARKKGDIPRSQDVTAAATYIGFLAVVMTTGAFAVREAASTLMIFIDSPDRLLGKVLGPGGPGLMADIMTEALLAMAPFFFVPIVAVIASVAAQQAVALSGDKLQPKLSKLSIIKNAQQKFGPTGLVAFLKSLIKLIAIMVTLFLFIRSDMDRMIGASRADPMMTGAMMGDTLIVIMGVICAISVSIAAVDWIWQKFDHARKLKMSHQDIKDEHKASEGDPHMKAQRRQRGQDIAMNQMLLDVPKADVIIVNPTHYAVALKWSREKGSAPVCVAKGVDEIALRIREIGLRSNIPIHDDPPTARALHATIKIGHEIMPDQYRAVAAAIRFADSVRAAKRNGDTQ
ncbi:EscU/YscU/HrcU family type III secretion system export apparatus switch protein [Amaricoccus tamworthensis]|uniref:EscU/YscU/HrcU family type III secretion system export apparatus switch protein n=1 Tax=Amaricoccus tamworthensis TaxID=57002 RepID=UPI003C7A810D